MPRFSDRPRIRAKMEAFHRARRERSRKFESREDPQVGDEFGLGAATIIVKGVSPDWIVFDVVHADPEKKYSKTGTMYVQRGVSREDWPKVLSGVSFLDIPSIEHLKHEEEKPFITLADPREAQALAVFLKQREVPFQSFRFQDTGEMAFFINDPGDEARAQTIIDFLGLKGESLKHEGDWTAAAVRDLLRAYGFGLKETMGNLTIFGVSPQPWHPTGPTMTVQVGPTGLWKIDGGPEGYDVDELQTALNARGLYPESLKHEVSMLHRDDKQKVASLLADHGFILASAELAEDIYDAIKVTHTVGNLADELAPLLDLSFDAALDLANEIHGVLGLFESRKHEDLHPMLTGHITRALDLVRDLSNQYPRLTPVVHLLRDAYEALKAGHTHRGGPLGPDVPTAKELVDDAIRELQTFHATSHGQPFQPALRQAIIELGGRVIESRLRNEGLESRLSHELEMAGFDPEFDWDWYHGLWVANAVLDEILDFLNTKSEVLSPGVKAYVTQPQPVDIFATMPLPNTTHVSFT